MSPSILLLPGELKEQIGEYLVSGDLASLARVSRDMHLGFNPILYRTITCRSNPIEVLKSLNSRASLAAAVRKLSVAYESEHTYYYKTDEERARLKAKEEWDASTAMSAMDRLGSPECRLMGLTWRADFVIDKLSSLLCSEGTFQYLQALTIHPGERQFTELDYKFLALPSLEYLDYRQQRSECKHGDEDDPGELILYSKNVQASLDLIQPGASKLSTLRIHITIECNTFDNEPSQLVTLQIHSAIRRIASSINKLQLPRLREATLHVSDGWHLAADLEPFVEAHPFLAAASLNLTGFHLKSDQLPMVESFVGTSTDCAHILRGDRSVRRMTVWDDGSGQLSVISKSADGTWWHSTDTFLSFLRPNTSLQQIVIIPSANRGMTVDVDDDNEYLNTDCVTSLVNACPQVQHLELYVASCPALLLASVFSGLQQLEYIKLHYKTFIGPDSHSELEVDMSDDDKERRLHGILYRHISNAPDSVQDPGEPCTPQGLFPPQRYVRAIEGMRETANKLREVALHLRSWVDSMVGWEVYRADEEWREPDLEISYTFYVCEKVDAGHANVRYVVESERVPYFEKELSRWPESRSSN